MRYGSQVIAKLTNTVMRDGKKSIARKQIYRALEIVREKSGKDGMEVFETAIRNVTPQMEVRSRRVGGAAYQVPTPIRGPRGISLALRWIVHEARKRSSKEYHVFSEKLAAELLDAARGEGMAFQRKVTSHKMADSNKAFAHFRW